MGLRKTETKIVQHHKLLWIAVLGLGAGLVITSKHLTGMTVGEVEKSTALLIIGLALMVIGAVKSGDLEEEVEKILLRRKGERVEMTDPVKAISSGAHWVSDRDISAYVGALNAKEREHYIKLLHQVRDHPTHEDIAKGRIKPDTQPGYADRMLRIFEGENYRKWIERDERPTIDKDIREEINSIWKDWNGSPSTEQKDFLSKYGLEYQTTKGKHPKIYDPETKKAISVSSTPSCQFAGKKIGSDIKHMLSYRSEYKPKIN